MGVRVQALAACVEDETEERRLDEEPQRSERFGEMVERQAKFMFQVAFGLLRNRQDAEDAVQEALLKLYRGEAWLRMENERGFLARTVWRGALDASRAAGGSVVAGGCIGGGGRGGSRRRCGWVRLGGR